ncbi:MAG TPA: ankyrin repeat domain-containing protein [Candidatus Rhabdochlamydia sp.]|jgi:ankyrin repeat protein|nr:ankyrin repeat domain-containing protein [Candidatus Rhabdochlamydia sp.]
MTSPLSFLRDPSHQTNSSFSSKQKLSERTQRLISLFKNMIPISNETTDYQNNHSRLWVLKNGTLLGTVSHSDGKITCISSNKIINSCTEKPISLKNPKRLQELQIDLAYVPEQKKLVIFPHLRAAGDDQKIAQVATRSLNPKPPASWVPHPFTENPEKISHMFRTKNPEGHFTEDTPENRAYIRTAVSDPSNRESINKHGVELYSKIMPDGYRAWAYVKNGLITNGGRDKPWRKWVANNNPKGPGGQVESRNFRTHDEFTFQERLQADCLTKVYNKSIRNNPWTPHPTESKSAARDVGGVRNQTGIILDLLKELEEGVYDEYMFFLPGGENLLSKEEILQIVREIARGIYVDDTVPFFSLNMNADHQLYPIVHPAYQNTYVGYVISMLDYHLKGFWTGQLFEEGFIEQWNKDPKVEESSLREHSFPITEFANFNDTIRDLLKAEGVGQMTSLSDCQLVFSCRMIGKQKGINKTENLFVLDADVELVHTVEWTPVGEEQEACFRILNQACKTLCEQIKEKGFAMPAMKKWLEALKIMNFFSCYFRTLQEGDKIPQFHENLVLDKEKICPPIFPQIPYPRGPFVEFQATDVFTNLSAKERGSLQKYCQIERENASHKKYVQSILMKSLKEFSIEGRSNEKLSQEELILFVDTVTDVLKARYLSTEKSMNNLLVDLKIKMVPRQDLTTEEILSLIDEHLFRVFEINAQTQTTISWKKFFWRSFYEETKLLEGLQEMQKLLEATSSWIQNPLSFLTKNEKWFFDLNSKTLGLRAKSSSDEAVKVFGGYEPTLEDTESKKSALAERILKAHAKKLSSLESEEFLVLKKESGRLFKLPVEDTFPVSSHGISYSAMKLTASLESSSDEAFLCALHAIRQSDKQAFTNVGMVDWNRLDAFGRSAIHYASIAGWDPSNGVRHYTMGDSFSILQALTNKGADLLIKDSQGWTALHYAAAAGNFVALGLFLDAEKSLLNIPALNGETPLYLAVQKNQLPCVKMLLEAGADLSIKPMHGWNVLMSAIHNGHEEMALLLVKTDKMDLESSWRGGKTALHFAIEMEMEKLLEELLNRGVDRNRIYNGQTPLSLASAQNWQRGMDLLHAEKTENQNSWCSVM